MRIGGEADRRARRQQNGFAQDSALEGTGFELLVPPTGSGNAGRADGIFVKVRAFHLCRRSSVADPVPSAFAGERPLSHSLERRLQTTGFDDVM
jgi:hypothetical protein